MLSLSPETFLLLKINRGDKGGRFIDNIGDLSLRIQKQVNIIQTEEATKAVVGMPFICWYYHKMKSPIALSEIR